MSKEFNEEQFQEDCRDVGNSEITCPFCYGITLWISRKESECTICKRKITISDILEYEKKLKDD